MRAAGLGCRLDKGVLEPAKARWMVQCKAADGKPNPSTGPEPGSTRKGTARDARKLAQIFGPSRYPAFVPDESLIGNSRLPPSVKEPGTASGAAPDLPSPFGTSLKLKGGPPTRSSFSSKVMINPSEVQPAVQKATHWKELVPVLAQGSNLGAENLLLVAERLSSLASAAPPTSDTEQRQLQDLGKQLAAGTRSHISTAYTLSQVSSVLRSIILTGFTPSENWLFAAEMMALASMQEMQMQQAARLQAEVQAATSGQPNPITPEALEFAAANDLAFTKVLLGFCACLLEADYSPRDSWVSVLVNCLNPVLRHLADKADDHMLAEAGRPARTGPDIRRASKDGLIVMPEQVQPDQVTTADGGLVELDTSPAAASTWDVVPQLGPAEWGALAQLLMRWEPEAVSDAWKQTYLEASYGALVATGRLVSQELQDGATPDMPPLATRVMHATVQADVATSLLLMGVKPDERWLSSLAAASAAVFQRVLSDESAGDSGFVTHPAAVTNLIVVLRQCDVTVDQAWLEAGLMAAASDQTRVAGDQLTALLVEICRAQLQLREEAVQAAAMLASRASQLWDEQAELDKVLQQRRQQAAAGGGAGLEPGLGQQDVTGFSAGGLVGLLYALSSLGALQLMPPAWLQSWGEHAVRLVSDMDAQGILLSLQQAGEAGVLLPAKTIHALGGKLLQMLHKQVSAPEAAGAGSEPEIDGLPCSDLFLALLSGLGSQPAEMPTSWLPQLQELTVKYMDRFTPNQLIDALQVLGLAAAPVQPAFIKAVLQYYQSRGGLASPDGCTAMSRGLQAVAAESGAFQVVEDALMTQVASAESKVQLTHWRDMLLSMAMGGHVPDQPFWSSLAAATQQVDQLSIEDLVNMLAAYGALRTLRSDAVGDLGAPWAAALCTEALKRLPLTSTQQEYLALLSSLGALQQGGYGFSASDCTAMEQAGLRYAEKLLPDAVSSCCIIFAACGHNPSAAWCRAAASAMEAALDTAEAQDVALFMKGVAGLPALKEAMPAGLLKRVMEHAGKLASTNNLLPSQLVSFMVAASEVKHVPGVGGLTPAVSAMMERALSARALLAPGEVAELVRAVFALGVRPPPRWLTMMLARLEQGDIAEAGPQGITTIASCLLASNTAPPPGLLDKLINALPMMTGVAVQALTALEEAQAGRGDMSPQEIQPQLDLLTRSSIQLMHSLTNLLATVPPRERKSFGGEGLRVWYDVAQLLDKGVVPAELHDSLLYAAARTTPRSAAMDPSVISPASVLAVSAVKATGDHLATYSANQLLTCFCTMSSMHMPLTPEWMERFWEYSRSKLAGCPVELLVGSVTGIATARLSPPSIWEQALLEALQPVIPKLGVQEVHSLVFALAGCGIRPPSDTVQSLLDAALSSQQVSAARLKAVDKSSDPAGSSTDTSNAGEDKGTMVSSTRVSKRRAAMPTTVRKAEPAAAGGLADQAAIKAAAMACGQEVKLSVDLVRQVQDEFGYQPDSLWLAQWQEAVGVALNSPYLPGDEKAQVAEQMQQLLQSR